MQRVSRLECRPGSEDAERPRRQRAGPGLFPRGRVRRFCCGRTERPGQKVMDGPFPPAHPGADDLVGEVLGQRGALLPGLGVAWGGDVAHRVEPAGVSLEGQGLGDGADGLAGGAEHLLRFRSAQVFAVLAVALVDQFSVEVLAIDLDDGSGLLRAGCVGPW